MTSVPSSLSLTRRFFWAPVDPYLVTGMPRFRRWTREARGGAVVGDGRARYGPCRVRQGLLGADPGRVHNGAAAGTDCDRVCPKRDSLSGAPHERVAGRGQTDGPGVAR